MQLYEFLKKISVCVHACANTLILILVSSWGPKSGLKAVTA